MTAKKDTLLLGTRKGLVIYRLQDGQWTYDNTHFLGIPVSYACVDPRNGYWWAGLDHGHWGCKLHYSTDQGGKWTEVTAPKYPEGSEIKPGVPATLRYIWCIQPGLASEPERLYVGSEPGGLFQSDDSGKSWTLVQSLWDHPSRVEKWFGAGRDYPGIHSICVDPNDANHILVGISVAGVFETKDGGDSWEAIGKGMQATYLPNPNVIVGQDPHILVSCANDFNQLWTQHHCGIFRSTDGGANWVKCSEQKGAADFGFAVAVHEENPEVAWVVPADSDAKRVAYEGRVIVSRTTDGGKTWQELTNGLPQHNAFDITYRHALDLTGDTLCFGTTTGNVFLSQNGGDDWEVLSNYLPMVYSVRFG